MDPLILIVTTVLWVGMIIQVRKPRLRKWRPSALGDKGQKQKNQSESPSLLMPDQPFPLNQGVDESLQENLLLSTWPYCLSVELLFVGLLSGFFFGLVWF